MRWWPFGKRDADLDRELQSDLELEEEEQREHGLSAEEARYAARRAFGNPTLIHEQTHATGSWSWLASLGIYALISYSVNQRTKEIGICMALGASPWRVQRGVPARTLMLTLAGVALGTVGSFVLSRWIASLLFGTTPANPAVFSGVSLLLCVVALTAAYVPSMRASRIDPMQALRTE